VNKWVVCSSWLLGTVEHRYTCDFKILLAFGYQISEDTSNLRILRVDTFPYLLHTWREQHVFVVLLYTLNLSHFAVHSPILP